MHIFKSLLVILVLLGTFAQPPGAALARISNQVPGPFAQRETVNTNWQTYQDIPASYELVGENDTFKLYADPTTLGFKVIDKRSGYIWSSGLDEFADGDKLNKSWKAFASSGISIDYLDPKAVNKRISITNSNHSMDVKMIDQGFDALVTFIDYSITVGVTVRLEENGVSVEVPFASIKEENVDYKLGLIYVYPFFGATREDSVPGYMLIPDGSGSLIRFNVTTKATNMFYGRYYGDDLGMITSVPYDPMINRPYKISLPVMGMVHGEKQNAYIEVVEKGASYGEIQAHPSGIITNFNFIYNAFIYNESYFQATNRSGDGVTTIQPHMNEFDIKIHYRFLTGTDSDYVGMAKSYQQYLIEKGMLKKVADPGSNIGIRLEFLGGEKEKILVWFRSIPMTTVGQMSEILDGLNIKNSDVIYYGWQPLGASSMPPKTLNLERSLGDLEQLRALSAKVATGGGSFSLYLDPQAALRDESGYSPRNDLAMSITDVNLMGYNRHKVNYYLNLDALDRRYSSLSEGVFSKLHVGLALDGIGSVLYSDFKSNHFLNRENAIQKYQELLGASQGPLSFYLPNDYLFADMQAYYDIPLANNGYIYASEAVPFLQIVLAGYVPYYGPALNFSSNLRDDLLKQVDFGVYPSYFLSNEVTAKMLDTRSDWIYTSSYSQWGTKIEETYNWMNSLLGPVKGQEILARQMLADGVFATTYANGKQIIVNYTAKPYRGIGFVVDSKGAIIREVAP